MFLQICVTVILLCINNRIIEQIIIKRLGNKKENINLLQNLHYLLQEYIPFCAHMKLITYM